MLCADIDSRSDSDSDDELVFQRKPPCILSSYSAAAVSQGAASPYSPYFSTLPEGTDCLIHWSKQEQQLLAGEGKKQSSAGGRAAEQHSTAQHATPRHATAHSITQQSACSIKVL